MTWLFHFQKLNYKSHHYPQQLNALNIMKTLMRATTHWRPLMPDKSDSPGNFYTPPSGKWHPHIWCGTSSSKPAWVRSRHCSSSPLTAVLPQALCAQSHHGLDFKPLQQQRGKLQLPLTPKPFYLLFQYHQYPVISKAFNIFLLSRLYSIAQGLP